MKMYPYIMHDSSAPRVKFVEGIFEFSHMLFMGLIKGLCANWSIFSTFSTEIHCFLCLVIVNDKRNIFFYIFTHTK